MANTLSYMEMYRKYEAVRISGKYNMITDATKAAKKAKLSKQQYKYVLTHYNSLKEAYNEYIKNSTKNVK